MEEVTSHRLGWLWQTGIK